MTTYRLSKATGDTATGLLGVRRSEPRTIGEILVVYTFSGGMNLSRPFKVSASVKGVQVSGYSPVYHSPGVEKIQIVLEWCLRQVGELQAGRGLIEQQVLEEGR